MNVLTSPPMPEWNNLSNEERVAICDEGEMYSCSCSGARDAGFYVYLKVRELLIKRERHVLAATMAGPPPEHFALSDANSSAEGQADG